MNGRFDRPLVSGSLHRSDVVLVVAGATVVAVIAELLLPQPTGLGVAAVAALAGWASAVQPFALQRRGLIGLVVLAGAYLVLPICLAVGFDALARVVPLALFGAGALAHKDVRDEVGDRAAGKRTLLVQVGYQQMAGIAVTVAVLGVVGLGVLGGPGWWCLPAVVAITGLIVLVVQGHQPRTWLIARAATVSTAVLVGLSVALG